MTKAREPASIENTLRNMLGVMTIEVAAERTGRQVGYLHALTDPDRADRRLCLDDARKLDLLWQELGHPGFPLLAAQSRLLDAEASSQFAEAAQLGALTLEYAIEAGQALPALIAATLPGASLDTLRTALKECVEADECCSPIIAHLRDRIARMLEAPPDTS